MQKPRIRHVKVAAHPADNAHPPLLLIALLALQPTLPKAHIFSLLMTLRTHPGFVLLAKDPARPALKTHFTAHHAVDPYFYQGLIVFLAVLQANTEIRHSITALLVAITVLHVPQVRFAVHAQLDFTLLP